MDLRKSVEKAKERRSQTQQSTEHPQDVGWISPTYNESRSLAVNSKRLNQNRCICINPDAPEVVHYKVLRTRIQHRCQAKGWNTIMITSVLPGEGKTLTSVNLALTFARQFNQTVLLVDCDLLHQNVHKYMGLSSEAGLGHYLMNGTRMKDLIIWPQIEKLTLISGGEPIMDSSELLGSPRMASLVSEMKSRYPDRYIFFDVPPLLFSADAITLTPLVDAILIIVESGKTPLPEIQKALDLIPQEKFLGFVLNRQKTRPKGYYGYSY